MHGVGRNVRSEAGGGRGMLSEHAGVLGMRDIEFVRVSVPHIDVLSLLDA